MLWFICPCGELLPGYTGGMLWCGKCQFWREENKCEVFERESDERNEDETG